MYGKYGVPNVSVSRSFLWVARGLLIMGQSIKSSEYALHPRVHLKNVSDMAEPYNLLHFISLLILITQHHHKAPKTKSSQLTSN
ncbi:hypothetical protein Trydic_g132 [Trypoxylus dichotomus]